MLTEQQNFPKNIDSKGFCMGGKEAVTIQFAIYVLDNYTFNTLHNLLAACRTKLEHLLPPAYTLVVLSDVYLRTELKQRY